MPPESGLGARSHSPCSADQARKTAAEAFVFGFPLVTTMTVMRQATNVAAPVGGRAPINQFAHMDSFPDPGFRSMVAANVETLYSLAWLDLAAEPVVLSLPDTEGRSYLVSLVSAWTEIIAGLGPRTRGTGDGSYALTGPNWKGSLPDGVQRLRSSTETVMVIGHTHASGPEDLLPCRAIQQKLSVAPLSARTGGRERMDDAVDTALAAIPTPFDLLMEMGAERFLSELAGAMVGNPPAQEDRPLLDRLATLGLRSGELLRGESLPDDVHDALELGLDDGKSAVASPPPPQELGNGWRTLGAELGRYGCDYLRRAQVANVALGTALPEDACFPIASTDVDGHRTNGRHRYRLRFEPGRLPPARALWSLAVYDMDQLFVSNPIDRYALGNRNELELGADGSLEIVIQKDPANARTNWLPVPEGDFYLMLHLYWPEESVLDGSWTIPPVQRVG
jgi:hypothetical protein